MQGRFSVKAERGYQVGVSAWEGVRLRYGSNERTAELSHQEQSREWVQVRLRKKAGERVVADKNFRNKGEWLQLVAEAERSARAGVQVLESQVRGLKSVNGISKRNRYLLNSAACQPL